MPKDIIVLGGILAGGLSRRMDGKEKALLKIGGETLLDISAARLQLQVRDVVVNANGDAERFGSIEFPVISDIIDNYAGPLAGVHTLLNYAKNSEVAYTHVASVAADTPYFPHSFVQSCVNALEAIDGRRTQFESIAIAMSGGFRHPVFGLWPVSLFPDISTFLETEKTRKVMAFVQNHKHSFVEFPMVEIDSDHCDPFFNINTPLDMETACAINSRMKPGQTS